MSELVLIKSSNFGNVKCDFWQNDTSDILMTREQIGLALEYSDPRIAIYKIHERHKDRLDKYSVVTNLTTTDGKTYQTYLYNSKGIMEICRWSQQPKADAFMDWVWEVVESIRKHGAYATPATLDKMIASPDFGIKLLSALKEEQEKRKNLERKVEQDKPKVLFAESVASSKNDMLIGELAKLIKQNGVDIGEKRLFAWMRNHGYLISRKGTDYNAPTQKAMELGLFRVKETAITHSDGHVTISRTTKVTGKGQQYFINKFLGDKRDAG